ncbi:MAG: DoxX family protein [Chthoniobacteraceae bacterium]
MKLENSIAVITGIGVHTAKESKQLDGPDQPGIAGRLLSRLFATTPLSSVLVARIVLAGVMLLHGAQKLFGWFGGYGFTGTMNFFTATMHIPWVFALAAILAESVGAIALLVGLGTRLAAAAIATNMAVALLTSHLGNGFFMNWFGNQKGEGFEYHLLAIGLALVLMIQGGGRWSADGWITRHSNSTR